MLLGLRRIQRRRRDWVRSWRRRCDGRPERLERTASRRGRGWRSRTRRATGVHWVSARTRRKRWECRSFRTPRRARPGGEAQRRRRRRRRRYAELAASAASAVLDHLDLLAQQGPAAKAVAAQRSQSGRWRRWRLRRRRRVRRHVGRRWRRRIVARLDSQSPDATACRQWRGDHHVYTVGAALTGGPANRWATPVPASATPGPDAASSQGGVRTGVWARTMRMGPDGRGRGPSGAGTRAQLRDDLTGRAIATMQRAGLLDRRVVSGCRQSECPSFGRYLAPVDR
jgi:hypothetical protein